MTKRGKELRNKKLNELSKVVASFKGPFHVDDICERMGWYSRQTWYLWKGRLDDHPDFKVPIVALHDDPGFWTTRPTALENAVYNARAGASAATYARHKNNNANTAQRALGYTTPRIRLTAPSAKLPRELKQIEK